MVSPRLRPALRARPHRDWPAIRSVWRLSSRSSRPARHDHPRPRWTRPRPVVTTDVQATPVADSGSPVACTGPATATAAATSSRSTIRHQHRPRRHLHRQRRQDLEMTERERHPRARRRGHARRHRLRPRPRRPSHWTGRATGVPARATSGRHRQRPRAQRRGDRHRPESLGDPHRLDGIGPLEVAAQLEEVGIPS